MGRMPYSDPNAEAAYQSMLDNSSKVTGLSGNDPTMGPNVSRDTDRTTLEKVNEQAKQK